MFIPTFGKRLYDSLYHTSLANSQKGAPWIALWNGFESYQDYFLFGTERQLHARCHEVFDRIGHPELLPLGDRPNWRKHQRDFYAVYQSFFQPKSEAPAFLWIISRYTSELSPRFKEYTVLVSDRGGGVPAECETMRSRLLRWGRLPLRCAGGKALEIPVGFLWPADPRCSDLVRFVRVKDVQDPATRESSKLIEEQVQFLKSEQAADLGKGKFDVGSVDDLPRVTGGGVRYWHAYVLRLGKLSPGPVYRRAGEQLQTAHSWHYPRVEGLFMTIHPGDGFVARLGTWWSDFNSTLRRYAMVGAALDEIGRS